MRVEDASPSSLLCDEDGADLNDGKDEVEACVECSISENEGDYVERLIERENRSPSSVLIVNDCSPTSPSWLRLARLEAFEWILNMRQLFGFQLHTAYLSMAYFDRFLSMRFIDEGKLWAVRLLSVACLSLAAKMEEAKVPGLSEFQVEDFHFETKLIQRMELLVLNTLEWKMISITPFSYLPYFVSNLCFESSPRGLVSRAMDIIMTTAKEINLVDQRPSIIAAAAVLAASNCEFSRETLELTLKTIPVFDSIEHELVFFSYSLMQRTEMGKLKTPKFIMTRNRPSKFAGSSDNQDSVSLTSAAGKKRRLSYSDCDEDCPEKRSRPDLTK